MPDVVGTPLERVDGPAKVTGAATYTADHRLPDLTHAVLVTSAIAQGRIEGIDAAAAEAVPGVLAVLTHENAPRVRGRLGRDTDDNHAIQALQDAEIRYADQPVAVVVAETLEQAREAARRVVLAYKETAPQIGLDPVRGRSFRPKHVVYEKPDTARGAVRTALERSPVRVEAVYTTARQTQNPMEPHATIAMWEAPRQLTLYDATQGLFDCRRRVAKILGLRESAVRVVSPYLGGGFGSKGPVWSHVIIAALAAKHVGRPVKLVLERRQMFGPVGWRGRTRQTVALGAERDGTLTALQHHTLAETSTYDAFMEACGLPARMLYASATSATSHRLVRATIATPSYARAPGWATGTFALECAMDELAWALDIDPIELRLRNHADEDPATGHPWSSKHLRECYYIGATRFGWHRRARQPGVWREGGRRIGWGMATSVYPTHRSEASALARLHDDGTLVVETGSQDLGTGTYTILTQIAADALGTSPGRVLVRIGDTRLPESPMSGGSQTAASAGSAVHEAVCALRAELVRLAVSDPASPLHGVPGEAVGVEDGRIFDSRVFGKGESLESLLVRQGRDQLEKRARATPGPEAKRYAMYAFGAQFAEVRVDPELGAVRVSRMVGVFDVGRALNARTARSQLLGGMVWGIGMALTEDTVIDSRLGRVVTANLADYHVPVASDVPDLDVSWIGARDEHANPVGAKGLGELGITGTAAAIANAVFHATGRRVRDLPITLDKLL
ncbi:MAG TPA: xanthine dehydrogenase family protein molybdopterin-binding subunit [Methylomirabilota bacterium]|nr:xanthine dehydrogenase family protein molybdopterin-binding subunit [Methylomirabilota bacterium]